MASFFQSKAWTQKFSRTGYFLGAVVLHLVVFVMVATLVIFPAFHPPPDEFDKSYVPAAAPPPPPPVHQETVQVPTPAPAQPTTVIQSTSPVASFTVPMPQLNPLTTTTDVDTTMKQQKPMEAPKTLSPQRLSSIRDTLTKNWGRSRNDILESNGDPRNITAKFPVYLASYADGDWQCNNFNEEGKPYGKIVTGSLPNLIAKMNEWSKGNITGQVMPEGLNIGGPDLMDKRPPFIFFVGHKDFHLTEQEVQNLRDYLQVGGAIWGDNALAGQGSRFDVAFRREMKKVVPDLDKNFEPLPTTSDIFAKSWFPLTKVPEGMNYYSEPIEHLDIDGKLAILYTPNDYSDMFCMRILPGDETMQPEYPTPPSPLFTSGFFWYNRNIFFRNFELPACLNCDQLGMNIIGHMLVRFDKDLQLTP
jgi:hypothetical protein